MLWPLGSEDGEKSCELPAERASGWQAEPRCASYEQELCYGPEMLPWAFQRQGVAHHRHHTKKSAEILTTNKATVAQRAEVRKDQFRKFV